MDLAQIPPSTRDAILSIDVDDLLIAHLDFAGEPVPEGFVTRISHELETALRVLDECQSHATFFVNAQYVDQLGSLVGEIVTNGHTLASHGFRHSDVSRLSISEFRDDLRRSLELLSPHQEAIVGYRAPAFSMPYQAAHFDVLLDEGVRYISTGAGVSRCDAPRSTDPVALECGLLHVPISTRFWGGGLKYPVGYGSVARLAPERIAVGAVRREIRSGRFFHFYCHPFEIAGLDAGVTRHVRSARWRLASRIFAARCRDREGLFRRIFESARFGSIESSLTDALS